MRTLSKLESNKIMANDLDETEKHALNLWFYIPYFYQCPAQY